MASHMLMQPSSMARNEQDMHALMARQSARYWSPNVSAAAAVLFLHGTTPVPGPDKWLRTLALPPACLPFVLLPLSAWPAGVLGAARVALAALCGRLLTASSCSGLHATANAHSQLRVDTWTSKVSMRR
jgi:hypothetical protein